VGGNNVCDLKIEWNFDLSKVFFDNQYLYRDIYLLQDLGEMRSKAVFMVRRLRGLERTLKDQVQRLSPLNRAVVHPLI